jgi:uncharacterized membrane protein
MRPERLMGLMFIGVGSMHFVAPKQFDSIIPDVLPATRALTLGSGVVEVLCGVGLLRRWAKAPEVSVVVLAAVFPANVKQACDSGHAGA